MAVDVKNRTISLPALIAVWLSLGAVAPARAQQPDGGDKASGSAAGSAAAAQTETKPSVEVYGFAMLDIGHNFTQIDPNWFDTLRVTRLNSFEDEFCCDNNTFAGVRQSR